MLNTQLRDAEYTALGCSIYSPLILDTQNRDAGSSRMLDTNLWDAGYTVQRCWIQNSGIQDTPLRGSGYMYSGCVLYVTSSYYVDS
jgi:hypothetical protein